MSCACLSGYEGKDCDGNIDDCQVHACQNNGTCVDQLNNYTCQCAAGFTGDRCDTDVDDCDFNSCLNGGTCVDGINSVTCQCAPGYHELSSDFDLVFDGSVDDYTSASYNIPDMTATTVSFWMQTTDRNNYGTPFSYALSEEVGSDNALTISDYTAIKIYVNGEAAYSTHGIQDDNWHHIAVTWTNTSGDWKLYDNGLVVDGGNGLGVGGVISGKSCSLSHGGGLAVIGQEQDYLGGGFTPDEAFIGSLHGLNWWSKELSVSEVSDLATSCNQSLRGDVMAWADFQLNVEGNINMTAQSLCDDTKECLSSPCENNATCTDHLGGYRCFCPPGFTSVHCEVNIDDCLGTTCDNGGMCVDRVNDFYCTCPPAFHGKNCELDVTSCSPNPCRHGGNCTESGGGAYSCSCSPGYDGNDCEVDIDECSSGPCTNGGTCVDMVNDYYCDCPNGFFGQNCDGEVDYCNPNLCQHGGTCQPITNDYSCTCPAGYTGYSCEINIDECEGVVCMNNGTCEDGIAAYTCRCVAGFTGTHCGTDIDECQGNPCENGGACVDGVASYTCDCPDMFTGYRCELVILPNLPQTTQPYVSTGKTKTASTEMNDGSTAQEQQTVPIIAGSVAGGIASLSVLAVLSWFLCKPSTGKTKMPALKYVHPKVDVIDDSMILAELPGASDRSMGAVRALENPYIFEDFGSQS
uniref:Uncharacterized protein n=1 Tax=Branchiostoma floridae TaxID=7739 RepID=C3Y723_BRAFL|eukprot:XP_002608123.1 hypothetical protein BRAFLDRAFT_91399 [Branchiostoma floridae]